MHDWFFDAFSFHFPEMFRSFCGICLTFVLEGIAVVPKSVFKCVFCKTVVIDSVTSGIAFQDASFHFWEMKRKGIKKSIMHWSVIDHAKPYRNGSKRWNLCLTEKYHILTSPVNLINKRSELVSKCRYESKFQLINYKVIPPLISKTEKTISSYGNMSNFIKNKCI